ncbi:MAG: choice-of-anchor J domain-containing protein [Bacteroidales bacterium]|nr:choice-of-anchor J domain-containing protein [Bacteroidales bacterium]
MKTKKQFTTGIFFFLLLAIGPSVNCFSQGIASSGDSKPGTVPAVDTVYKMDFESIPDFSLTFDTWTTVDVDQHTTYGIVGHTFPHQMEAMAFLCFNPAQVVPSMASDPNIQAHGGQRFGACFSSDSSSNNDWFISPKIQLGTNGSFSFWIKSYSDLYGLDKYQVLVSITDNNPASFIPISGPDSLQTTLTWTRKTYSLAQFNNQMVYVAVRCVSSDNWLMMIDDLEVRTQATNDLTADFIADKTTPDVGEGINFTDESTGIPTSWSWSFPGAVPAVSNLQNPQNIKYSVPGAYSVTLIVSNGTTSDTLTKTGYITVTGYPSNVSLDFESNEDFTLVFEPWTTIDVNGGNTYGISEISFPHQFAPMAYICFVPSNTSPALTNMAPHSGVKLGCCFSSEPPYNPNNKWLISPKMTLGADPRIELWVQSYNNEYGDEKFNIAVSTTDLNPSSFTLVTTTPETAPLSWTLKSFSLADYVSQTVYVGIQCVTNDSFIFMVDDIAITSAVGIDEPDGQHPISIYPNPARGKFNVNPGNDNTFSFTLDLVNTLGKTVRSWPEAGELAPVSFDIHDVPSGIYMVRFRQGSMETYRKITIIN